MVEASDPSLPSTTADHPRVPAVELLADGQHGQHGVDGAHLRRTGAAGTQDPWCCAVDRGYVMRFLVCHGRHRFLDGQGAVM